MRYYAISFAAFALMFILTACSASSESARTPSPFYSAAAGDTIHLGGHDWLVLDVKDDRALVISEKILSRRMWHYEQRAMTWEPSEIRQYLNESFFYDTFSEEERAYIVEVNNVNNMNPWFGSAGSGSDTVDRVFLLSLEELMLYFGDSGILGELAGLPHGAISIAITDDYNPGRVAIDIETDRQYWWWLRTPGRFVSPWIDASAAVVSGGGDVVVYGLYLVMEGGVRPALWVRI